MSENSGNWVSIVDRKSLHYFLQADLEAHGESRWTFDLNFRNPALRYQRCLRHVEYWTGQKGIGARIMRGIRRYSLQRQSVITGISLPPGVCGPGLYIAHYGSIVINSRTRIGARLQIHSATNIGTDEAGATPVIGDDVYIGPGAVIYGPVRIGNSSAIGANSVVNKDVPAHSTAVGAPARVVNDRGSAPLRPRWTNE